MKGAWLNLGRLSAGLAAWWYVAGLAAAVAAPALPVPKHTRPLADRSISLAQAILLGMRTNPDVINARLDRVVQKFSLLVAQNAYQPQYQFTASLEKDNAFSGQASTNTTVSPGITYANTIGTQFAFQVDGSYTSPVSGRTTRQSTSTVSVTQPLMRGAGKVAANPLLDAQAQEKLNQLLYRNTIMNQITSIISRYHSLVKSYHSVTINRMALADSKEQLNHFRLRVKVGQAAGSELLTQQSQVATQRLTLASSENQLEQAKQSLLGLLGLNPNMDFIPEFNIYRAQITHALPAKAEAIKVALRNSTDYQTALTNLGVARRALQTAKDNTRWQLNAKAQTQIVHGGSGQQTSSATGDKTLALNLSIPIEDMTLKNDLLDAQVALESKRLAVKTTRQAVESLVINQLRDLKSQAEQVKMATQAVTLAKKTLSQSRLKLAYGRASAFEVASLREELTIKQLAEVNAKITYVDTYANFHQTIGLTLYDWNIQLKN